jgi:hypothetical protein
MNNPDRGTMKIEITKKEYRTLLDILHIADWVLHAYKTEEGPETEEFRNLEQKFLALAKEMGFEHFVEYDAEMKKYFPTHEYEETSSVMDVIVDYDNECFWDELTERLASRDLIQQEGRDKFMAMDFEERLIKTEVLREKYSKEFEQQGVNRVVIKE